MCVRPKIMAEVEGLDFLGGRFPGASLEAKVLDVAACISPSHGDCDWIAVVLCNGAVFLRPNQRATFEVRTPGGCGGPLSSEAFGLLVTLLSLRELIAEGIDPETIDPGGLDHTVQLEALRSYALLHPEWDSVRRLLG